VWFGGWEKEEGFFSVSSVVSVSLACVLDSEKSPSCIAATASALEKRAEAACQSAFMAAGSSSSSSRFDFGDYSATLDEEDLAPLSWRDHPDRSLADWTITIVRPDRSTDEYHVHKAMLAAGAQPSQYFKSIFRPGMREGNDQSSRIELEDSAAEAFPAYLDFAYTGELQVETESATALLHLSNYLRCRMLHDRVTTFMQEDLNADNAALYFAEAELYSLDRVSAEALRLSAAALPTARPEMLLALPPPLFHRVVHAPERVCCSVTLSKLIAEYCRGPHAESVDGPFLTSISSEEVLPSIDPIEALALLELAVTHAPTSGLSERCIAAATKHWQQALIPLVSQSTGRSGVTEHRPKRRRGSRSEAASSAPADSSAAASEHETLKASLPETLKISLLSRGLKAANASLDSQVAGAAEREAELKAQIAVLRSEKSKAEAELRRFKRIPRGDTMGGLIAEHDLDKVTYSASTEVLALQKGSSSTFPTLRRVKRKFGSTQPKAMPSHATDRDGWVYKSPDRRNGSLTVLGATCPVFYFE
jgi:hypothetical protein